MLNVQNDILLAWASSQLYITPCPAPLGTKRTQGKRKNKPASFYYNGQNMAS